MMYKQQEQLFKNEREMRNHIMRRVSHDGIYTCSIKQVKTAITSRDSRLPFKKVKERVEKQFNNLDIELVDNWAIFKPKRG